MGEQEGVFSKAVLQLQVIHQSQVRGMGRRHTAAVWHLSGSMLLELQQKLDHLTSVHEDREETVKKQEEFIQKYVQLV